MPALDDKGVRRRYPWNFMGSYSSEPWTAGPHGRPKGAQDLGVPSAIQRGKILIPMASESTALCLFISCYHHQPGGQTHSGQRSRFDCVCAGQLVRTVKRRSPIVSSESKGLRPCKCSLPDPFGSTKLVIVCVCARCANLPASGACTCHPSHQRSVRLATVRRGLGLNRIIGPCICVYV